MPNIPNDPIMLMSYLNTQLRDNYASLEELCKSMCVWNRQRSPQSWKQLASYTSRNAISLYRSLCSKIRA